jgi:hypothetical protein
MYRKRKNLPLKQDNGRPRLLSDQQVASLKDEIEASSVYYSSVDTIKNKFKDYVKMNIKAKGKSTNSIVQLKNSNINRSFKRYMSDIGATKAVAEIGTMARYKAERDVFNAVSLACTNLGMEPLTNKYLTINCDATQFDVGEKNGKVEVLFIGKRSELKGPLKVNPSDSSNDGLAFFIKYYMIITASGSAGPPIFVIQDPRMPEEDIDKYPVPGLGLDSISVGYIVFSHSRVPNKAFYKWLFQEIMVNFVVLIRKQFKTTCTGKVAWLQMDGEVNQITIFSDPAVQESLFNHEIEIGKLPASYTAIGQPCDAGNQFKALKTILKALSEDKYAQNDGLKENIDYAYDEHNKKYNGALRKEKMSYQHIKYGKFGLLKAHYALVTGLKLETIQESFHLTGIFDQITQKCNPETIIRALRLSISEDQVNTILKALPKLSQLMLEHGELKDEDYIACGIQPTIPCGVGKENLVLYQRRALICTNRALIHRENMKRAEKELNSGKNKRGRPPKNVVENNNTKIQKNN